MLIHEVFYTHNWNWATMKLYYYFLHTFIPWTSFRSPVFAGLPSLRYGGLTSFTHLLRSGYPAQPANHIGLFTVPYTVTDRNFAFWRGFTVRYGTYDGRIRQYDVYGLVSYYFLARRADASKLASLRTLVCHNLLNSSPIPLIIIYLSSLYWSLDVRTACDEFWRLFYVPVFQL